MKPRTLICLQKYKEGILNNYWDYKNEPGTDNIKVKSAYIEFEGTKLTVNDQIYT